MVTCLSPICPHVTHPHQRRSLHWDTCPTWFIGWCVPVALSEAGRPQLSGSLVDRPAPRGPPWDLDPCALVGDGTPVHSPGRSSLPEWLDAHRGGGRLQDGPLVSALMSLHPESMSTYVGWHQSIRAAVFLCQRQRVGGLNYSVAAVHMGTQHGVWGGFLLHLRPACIRGEPGCLPSIFTL